MLRQRDTLTGVTTTGCLHYVDLAGSEKVRAGDVAFLASIVAMRSVSFLTTRPN